MVRGRFVIVDLSDWKWLKEGEVEEVMYCVTKTTHIITFHKLVFARVSSSEMEEQLKRETTAKTLP